MTPESSPLLPLLGGLSPLRLDALEAQLAEAGPVAQVHSGVRAALAAGRMLLAEVRRLYALRDDGGES